MVASNSVLLVALTAATTTFANPIIGALSHETHPIVSYECNKGQNNDGTSIKHLHGSEVGEAINDAKTTPGLSGYPKVFQNTHNLKFETQCNGTIYELPVGSNFDHNEKINDQNEPGSLRAYYTKDLKICGVGTDGDSSDPAHLCQRHQFMPKMGKRELRRANRPYKLCGKNCGLAVTPYLTNVASLNGQKWFQQRGLDSIPAENEKREDNTESVQANEEQNKNQRGKNGHAVQNTCRKIGDCDTRADPFGIRDMSPNALSPEERKMLRGPVDQNQKREDSTEYVQADEDQNEIQRRETGKSYKDHLEHAACRSVTGCEPNSPFKPSPMISKFLDQQAQNQKRASTIHTVTYINNPDQFLKDHASAVGQDSAEKRHVPDMLETEHELSQQERQFAKNENEDKEKRMVAPPFGTPAWERYQHIDTLRTPIARDLPSEPSIDNEKRNTDSKKLPFPKLNPLNPASSCQGSILACHPEQNIGTLNNRLLQN